MQVEVAVDDIAVNCVMSNWERSRQRDDGFTDDEVVNEDGKENEVNKIPAHECEFGSSKKMFATCTQQSKNIIEGKIHTFFICGNC